MSPFLAAPGVCRGWGRGGRSLSKPHIPSFHGKGGWKRAVSGFICTERGASVASQRDKTFPSCPPRFQHPKLLPVPVPSSEPGHFQARRSWKMCGKWMCCQNKQTHAREGSSRGAGAAPTPAPGRSPQSNLVFPWWWKQLEALDGCGKADPDLKMRKIPAGVKENRY